jgi:dipeptidyl aminopeptidase/acylaminoacyl peptidase
MGVTASGVAAGILLSLLAVHARGDAAEAPARGPFMAEDIYRVAELSDPQVSPDGGWVAYVVTTNDRDADEQRSAIWMVSWDGTQRLAMTAAASDTEKPRWSPDGRYLSFLSAPAGSDRVQLMLLDRRGGEARQLTTVTGDIHDYAWSPDGRRVALAMDQPAESSKPPMPIVIDSLHFKDDHDGYRGNGRRRHLYLVDVESRHLESLTGDTSFNEDLPTWSPDGAQLLFTRTHELGADPDGRCDLDVMDAKAGAAAGTLARPYVPNAQRLAFSADGKLITFLQGLPPRLNAYIQDRLTIMPTSGGAPRELAASLDRSVTSYAFSGGRAIAVTVEDDGATYPAQIDADRGTLAREVPPGPFVVSALSSGGGHTALLRADDHSLAEVYALEGGNLRKLTAHNDALMAARQFGAVDDLKFKSRDGTEVHALVVKPPGYVPGRRYPTLLWIHGGPNGQDEHALVIDGYEFEHQLFAAKGWVVLRVNYRGGTGRGAAYAQAIVADWGHKEVEDLLAGVDAMVKQGVADPDRLAIGGWSYGGILTDYTIATDRRFKAAISGAGSANQISMYGVDQYVLQYNNEIGTPWQNTALWLKLSYPFFHADRIHTPTLFLGGEKDFNVPVSGGEQMYQALKTLGVPAQLVVYPDQHHVFTRPSFVKDLEDRMSGWLERYVPPPASP